MKTGLLLCFVFGVSLSAQNADHVVIAELYGGGGTSGAVCRNDYVVLYNPSSASVSLAGWSIQRASGGGTSWAQVNLDNSISPYGYYLIQLKSAGANGFALSGANLISSNVDIFTGSGKLALLDTQTKLDGDTLAYNTHLIDFAGWGTAHEYEGRRSGGSAAASITNKNSLTRKYWNGTEAENRYGWGNGYDTDNNGNDFYLRSSFSSVLPVKLTSFTASQKRNAVIISWKTACEFNNKEFILKKLETGFKGSIWTDAAKIAGAGNSNSRRQYEFTDSSVVAGRSYRYRLEQTDNNGSKQYLGTVEIVLQVPEAEFILRQNYPNPFNPETNIIFILAAAAEIRLTVYNAAGKQIHVLADKWYAAGEHLVSWPANGIPTGIYLCELASGKIKLRRKMIKLK